MVIIGLTGGIGSGKSTVGAFLAARGAVIVDADLIARQVVAPETPGYAAVVERFGPDVVADDGDLDRAALADVVFRDPDARKDLEGITHPLIQAEIARQTLEAGSDAVVVLDIPLLKARRDPMAGVIVVDVPEEVAVARLVGGRGFDLEDAKRRIGAQIGRADRKEFADVVIDNSGDLAALETEVDRAWAWVEGLRGTPEDVTGSG
ncbi:MAG: dephospho-CoA kinase [Acidimicrobiales bacterium]